MQPKFLTSSCRQELTTVAACPGHATRGHQASGAGRQQPGGGRGAVQLCLQAGTTHRHHGRP